MDGTETPEPDSTAGRELTELADELLKKGAKYGLSFGDFLISRNKQYTVQHRLGKWYNTKEEAAEEWLQFRFQGLV